MTYPHVDDPYDSAENPQLRPAEFYGQMTADSWFVILEKGRGKVDFDPAKHGQDQRRTAIKLAVVPLPEHNIKNDVIRDMIAESRDWAGIVLPSIKACGTTLRELNGKFVKIGFEKTGQVYTKTDASGASVTRDSTTIVLKAVYPDEAACRAAFLSERGGNGASHTEPATTATPVNTEKATLLKFVTSIIEQAKGDQDAVAAKLAAMPLLAKHFSITSPEVIEALMWYQLKNPQAA